LHFWRTSVTNSLLVVSNDLSFFLNVESHEAILPYQETVSGKQLQQARDKSLYL
jgi:hypothetical protein